MCWFYFLLNVISFQMLLIFRGMAFCNTIYMPLELHYLIRHMIKTNWDGVYAISEVNTAEGHLKQRCAELKNLAFLKLNWPNSQLQNDITGVFISLVLSNMFNRWASAERSALYKIYYARLQI